jgi:hypothetical protein
MYRSRSVVFPSSLLLTFYLRLSIFIRLLMLILPLTRVVPHPFVMRLCHSLMELIMFRLARYVKPVVFQLSLKSSIVLFAPIFSTTSLIFPPYMTFVYECYMIFLLVSPISLKSIHIQFFYKISTLALQKPTFLF